MHVFTKDKSQEPKQDMSPQDRIGEQKRIIDECDNDIKRIGKRLDRGMVDTATHNEETVFYQGLKIKALEELVKLIVGKKSRV